MDRYLIVDDEFDVVIRSISIKRCLKLRPHMMMMAVATLSRILTINRVYAIVLVVAMIAVSSTSNVGSANSLAVLAGIINNMCNISCFVFYLSFARAISL